MASTRPGSPVKPVRPSSVVRRGTLLRACVVTAAAVCVAGCVNMPASGPMGAISASPQTTAPGGDFIEPFPSGPSQNETPWGIVGGFLAASASYPVHAAIAQEYLTGAASKTWNPGWTVTVFSTFGWSNRAVMQHPKHGASVAMVEASGQVQSRFNGSGQFVSAQQGQSDTTDAYRFNLVKVNGQWRISNPPGYRLLTVPQFGEFYRAQDLYFVNQSILSSPNQALVPDSVFVPLGSSVPDLVNNLVKALLPNPATAAGGPKSALLQNAAETFPVGTKLSGVTLDGTTAVVNLTGLAKAGTTVLEQVSAQLTWTLSSARSGPPQSIQSVELELDGKPWIPPTSICGISQSRSSVQNEATYPCYNPYPSSPASFSFAAHGQAWSRCGSETSALHGLVGPVVSVFRSAQQCGDSEDVPTASASVPQSVPLPAKVGTPSMVAVSSDGTYVAVYSPDQKAVFAGLAKDPASLSQVQGGIGSGVTALSWDRNHDLWIAQNGNVFMAPITGKAIQISSAPAGVTSLSVAPDGVRIALIVPSAEGGTVELAAITHGGQSSQGQRGSISEAVSIGNSVQIGPDLIQPDMLTWYDADNLIVLSGSTVKLLSEVPVDGQQSSSSQAAPEGAISITADGSTNALVAGLSGAGGKLALSTGLEGPWQSLGVSGLNPSYPG